MKTLRLAAALLFGAAVAAPAQTVRLEIAPLGAPLGAAPLAGTAVPLALPALPFPSALGAAAWSAPSAALPQAAPVAAVLPAAAVPAAAPEAAHAFAAALPAASEAPARASFRAAGADAVRTARALAPESGATLAAPAGTPEPRLDSYAPGDAKPAEPGHQVYLLSRPLRETVEIGPVGRFLHVAEEVVWTSGKMLLAWKATGHPTAGLAVLGIDVLKAPAVLTMQTLADLGQRYWRRKRKILRSLARAPGVTRLRVLTTGVVEFSGPLARRKENTGLVFVEADAPLAEDWGRFGRPIPLGGVAGTRVRLTVVRDGQAVGEAWTPTLGDLLDGKKIPAAVSLAWREALKSGGLADASVKILTGGAQEKGLTLRADLLAPYGPEQPLGAIAYGASVRKLIGLSWFDRARAWLGRAPKDRAIPISDSAVARPGAARAPGLKARLSRLWRRVTGSLIVVPADPK
jgi:hypothetical protein